MNSSMKQFHEIFHQVLLSPYRRVDYLHNKFLRGALPVDEYMLRTEHKIETDYMFLTLH